MAKPELHYHACIDCRARYFDACTTPPINSRCPTCRQGRPSIKQMGQEPRPCCKTSLKVATKDDLKTYRLRGDGPWWICRECSRQFGYDVRI